MNIVRFRLVTYPLLSLLNIVIFAVTLHVQLHVLAGRPLSDFPKIFLFSVTAGTLGVPFLLLIQYVAPSSYLLNPVVEVAWLFVGSALYLAGAFVILFVDVPLLCNDRKALTISEARTPSACMEFNTTRFLWWINTTIFIVAFVVITTWLLIQSARGSRRVWSTPITRLQLFETRDISTPVNRRQSFYITTSARLAPYLGQPQISSSPRLARHEHGSSADLLYPAGHPRVAPQPRQSREFTRARNVSIGPGYVRANDPSAALRDMNQPEYAAVPTADPNLPEDDPYDGYDEAMKPLPVQGRPGPAMRQNAPPPSAFSNPMAFSSEGSMSSTRSYPYPFPNVPPSQPPSRTPSQPPSMRDRSPLQTQPPDRSHTPSPLQYNQKPNGSLPYVPVPAPEELFRARENKNRQTAVTTFSLSPYYASQADDDAVSIASQYSTATTTTKINPDHSGTAPPVLPPPPRPPPVGSPPPIPIRSPRRQSLTHPDSRGVYGQQGSARPLVWKK